MKRQIRASNIVILFNMYYTNLIFDTNKQFSFPFFFFFLLFFLLLLHQHCLSGDTLSRGIKNNPPPPPPRNICRHALLVYYEVS